MAYSISFKTKASRTNDNQVVRLRITNRRKSAYWTTGIKLEEKHWDANKEVIKTSFKNSQRLNNSLHSIKTNDQNICAELSSTNPRFFSGEPL